MGTWGLDYDWMRILKRVFKLCLVEVQIRCQECSIYFINYSKVLVFILNGWLAVPLAEITGWFGKYSNNFFPFDILTHSDFVQQSFRHLEVLIIDG